MKTSRKHAGVLRRGPDTLMDGQADSRHIGNPFAALKWAAPNREHVMRSAFVVLAIATVATIAPAHAADIYGPAPGYGAAPPPAYQPPPARPYGYAPPAYGVPPVVAYEPPPGVIAAPEGPAYIVSQPAYQPGDEYAQAPFVVDGRRYYRECWVEWGQRRCALKPRWFW